MVGISLGGGIILLWAQDYDTSNLTPLEQRLGGRYHLRMRSVHRRGGNRLMPPVRHSLSIAGLPVIRTGVRRLVAFQNAAHAGGLVYEVSDPQAKDSWQDYRAVGEEMIG